MWRFLLKFFGTAIRNTQLLTLLKIHKEEVSTQVQKGTSGGIRNQCELLKAWFYVIANFGLDQTYYPGKLGRNHDAYHRTHDITEAGTIKVTIWLEVLRNLLDFDTGY